MKSGLDAKPLFLQVDMLTASMTSEFKNKYAYDIMQDICNKFIEVNSKYVWVLAH